MATETTLEELYTFDKDTGTVDPADYGVVESIVKSDVCSALGIESDVEMSTPMGRFLEWLSLHFTRVLGLNVQNANQLLVSAAAGQQLDAMAQWFQLERKPKSYSTVTVTCSSNSTNPVIIPFGSTIRNQNGDIFECITEGEVDRTIPPDTQEKDLQFEAIEAGPIDVTSNTVNIVDSIVPGWVACNNLSDGEIGAEIESDESLRARIQASRSVAPGFLGAIKNAVEAVMGSGSVMVLENNTGKVLPVHGVPLSPHSIFVCVSGLIPPTDANAASDEKVKAVAKAILENKPCGTGYTRSGSDYIVSVADAFDNSYEVIFSAPVSQEVTVSVQLQNRSYTGSDLIGDVKNAVDSWASAKNFKCGEDVYASDIITVIEENVSGIIVVECTVSDGGAYKGTSFVGIAATHKASINISRDDIKMFTR